MMSPCEQLKYVNWCSLFLSLSLHGHRFRLEHIKKNPIDRMWINIPNRLQHHEYQLRMEIKSERKNEKKPKTKTKKILYIIQILHIYYSQWISHSWNFEPIFSIIELYMLLSYTTQYTYMLSSYMRNEIKRDNSIWIILLHHLNSFHYDIDALHDFCLLLLLLRFPFISSIFGCIILIFAPNCYWKQKH